MDLSLSPEQQQIVDAAIDLGKRHAGHDRAKQLIATNDYDHELDHRLEEAGYLDCALGEETGPLAAALVAFEVARAAGLVAYGAGAIVAPMVTGGRVNGPVALARLPATQPVRYGPHAKSVLIDAGAEAKVLAVESADWVAVDNFNAGYPLARLKDGVIARAKSLGPGSGERLRNWWRCAIAIEAAGTMRAAVDTTVSYLNQRVQFGRPLGSFQALQHRLAECTVFAEGAKWLALEAIAKGATVAMSATAAAYAAEYAWHVFREVHQLHGAMGFTREYHLHVWSMRLRPLHVELGGTQAHQDAVAQTRFCVDAVKASIEAFSGGS